MLNFFYYFYMPWFRFSLRLQLLDGVVSMYACVFKPLEKVYKVSKRCGRLCWNADKLLSFGDSQSMARSSFPIGRHYR